MLQVLLWSKLKKVKINVMSIPPYLSHSEHFQRSILSFALICFPGTIFNI